MRVVPLDSPPDMPGHYLRRADYRTAQKLGIACAVILLDLEHCWCRTMILLGSCASSKFAKAETQRGRPI